MIMFSRKRLIERGGTAPRISSRILMFSSSSLIALLATVIMFSVIFSVAGMADQVNKSSVAMLFITLPQLFYTTVPLGRLLAPLFYVLVAFAALTSTISLLEVVVAYFIDKHAMTRKVATLMCGTIITAISVACSVSLGAWGPLSNFVVFTTAAGPKQGLLANLDHLASNWMLPPAPPPACDAPPPPLARMTPCTTTLLAVMCITPPPLPPGRSVRLPPPPPLPGRVGWVGSPYVTVDPPPPWPP